MLSLRLFGIDGVVYMNSEHYIILFVGFIFGAGFISLFDLGSEMFIYFYHKNIEYRERKRDKKNKERRD